ncbi:MAG: glucosamine-6-phosphate deaminase [Rhodospirillales bacterium]|nr:glucosamine-6-phosphate deaminase [Rhodospirillales bacterium]
MHVIIQADATAVATRAADMVEATIRSKPHPVIGLAAGATPMALYLELARRHDAGLDFSTVTVFGLDDYLGLNSNHPASCALTLRHHLIDRVNLAPSRVHLLSGQADGDLFARCEDYENRIAAAGGLDLQILGLGVNGHIGFNEPGCSLAGRTRPVALRSSTRATNRPIFSPAEEVPRGGITMGVATILSARRILLLATGSTKAQAVTKAVEGPLTAMVPASALQLHPDAVMLLDESAASGLAMKDDYKAEDALLTEITGGIIRERA